MANINDLKQSISEMGREKVLKLMQEIRQSRREFISVAAQRKRKKAASTGKKKKAQKKSKDDLITLLRTLPEDEKQKLLNELKENERTD